jgi:hypothetical protein
MLDCCRLVFREGGMEGFRACFADLVDPRRGNALNRPGFAGGWLV